ncbi:DUF805 domain-containing protein [Chenggangzhangella methanolivorans]|uniref:DUF805 domain-containing protein n=1 Tax=Chenggangzhangella methanolivorans TaxID=1437009 RepID=A0A9E6UNU5_9HYPH|nr:DUF805 domain-containing protein [Chenggangzhangella methanolivorans]QZN98969.1 DUF805 domain-containing protein [Chenggangzhangella methanolivorans]
MEIARRAAWLLVGFSGRVTRGAYLAGLIGSAAALILALLVFEPAALEAETLAFTPTVTAALVAGWWTWLALLVKRLRDVGLGWGWSLLLLLPGLQPVVLVGFAVPKSRPADGERRQG